MSRVYNIGISCIGSGVGQSVINSCRLSNLPLYTIGFGTNPFAYGAYDCDVYDYLASIYTENYVDALIEKCKEYKIDLLIPGHDDEVLVISQNIQKFKDANILPLVSGVELVQLCRDKERMSNELNKISNVFVRSFSKKDFVENKNSDIDFPLIAKPRSGYASRGIKIIWNVKELNQITEDYIIQELALPNKKDPNYNYYIQQLEKNQNTQVSEISIQVVVDQDEKLIGRMASYNKLNNGVPIEVVPFENSEVWEVVDKLMPKFLELGFKGPLNIQGRITDKGLKLFEMNPRFTGITGLRALMGFNEVETSIKKWLNINPSNEILEINHKRFGVRQTSDKSISIERNNKISELYLNLNGKEIKKQKTLLITGASGFLGRSFIKNISAENEFQIYAFGRNKEKLKELFGSNKIHYYDKDDFDSGHLSLGDVDVLLHFGFARPYCSNEQIAESLVFTSELFTKAVMNNIPAIVNISSQSVYGLEREPLWNENTPIAPSTTYAQAKYATEVLLNSLTRINNQLKVTSLRLAALSGGSEGLVISDVASKFARQVLENKPITIVGGSQTFEIMDVRDAVNAIGALLNVSPLKWKKVYNLGANKVYNIKHIAQVAIESARKNNCNNSSEIIHEKKDVKMNFGMNSSLFMKDTGWKPVHSIESTMDSLITYLNNQSFVNRKN